MFYSSNILSKKGALATIWLAAHFEKRLSKVQVLQTNLQRTISDILDGTVPQMALRLSSQILLGLVKIFQKKAKYLFDECSEAFSRVVVRIIVLTH